MKPERAYVLRFDDGSQVPYGVPDFLTEEEAADFLAHIRSEIEEGAAEYFAQCCPPAEAQASDEGGSDDEAGSGQAALLGQAVSFAARPSVRTRRLEDRANWLRVQGLERVLARLEVQRVAIEQQAQEQRRLAQQHERSWALREQQRSRGRGYGR